MIRKRLGLVAAVALVVVSAATNAARGDVMNLALFENSVLLGSAPTGVDATAIAPNIYGDFIVFQASTLGTFPGPGSAVLGTTTFEIENRNLLVPKTLEIVVDWSVLGAPVGIGSLNSTLSPVGLLTADAVAFTSTLSHNLASAGPATLVTPSVTNPSVQSVSLFALTQHIFVTLSPGETANFKATTNLNVAPGAAAPEPSRLFGILSVAGMLGLGLVWKLRRRSPFLDC